MFSIITKDNIAICKIVDSSQGNIEDYFIHYIFIDELNTLYDLALQLQDKLCLHYNFINRVLCYELETDKQIGFTNKNGTIEKVLIKNGSITETTDDIILKNNSKYSITLFYDKLTDYKPPIIKVIQVQ